MKAFLLFCISSFTLLNNSKNPSAVNMNKKPWIKIGGENKINGGDGTDIVEYQDSSTNYTAVKITDFSFQLIKNNIY